LSWSVVQPTSEIRKASITNVYALSFLIIYLDFAQRLGESNDEFKPRMTQKFDRAIGPLWR